MKLPENMSIITGRKYNGSYDDEEYYETLMEAGRQLGVPECYKE